MNEPLNMEALEVKSTTKVPASTPISPEIHRTVVTDQRQSDQDTRPGVCLSTSMTRVTIIPWHKENISSKSVPTRQFPARRSNEAILGTSNTYVVGVSNPYTLMDTGLGKLNILHFYARFLRSRESTASMAA